MKTKLRRKQELELKRIARALGKAKAQIDKMPDGEPKRVCKMLMRTLKSLDELVRECPQSLEDAGLL